MAGSILGNAVFRSEDPALLRGERDYVDDLSADDVLHAVFVRSVFPHATITGVHTDEAASMPGVVEVLTAEDLDLPAHFAFFGLDPTFMRPPLARGKVRFVGEPIAVVIADDRVAAVDAAETVVIDYEPLDAVVDPERALAEGAPVLFEEHGSNLAIGRAEWACPVDDPLADAEIVVKGRFFNQRLAPLPMEGNGVLVEPRGERLVVQAPTQMPHQLKQALADELSLDPAAVRVVVPAMGGGFGAKVGLYGETSVVAAVARRLDQPVKWVETRSEDMLALCHGRAQTQYVQLGLRRDGRITGLHAQLLADAGAYPALGMMMPNSTRRMSHGVYDIPAVAVDIVVAATNTTPIGAYRGAGRPEAAAMLERVIDLAAYELDIDPVELRRRNLLPPDRFPLSHTTDAHYDSGDYAKPLDEVVGLAGYEQLRADQAERRARGDSKLLGIGVACYVEITAGGNAEEYASVAIDPDGGATVRVGTSSHGQGHATAYQMLVADKLGIAFDDVRIVQSDTDEVRSGGGTGGSRSLQLGGSAVHDAAEAVLDKARNVAAHLLEASAEDIVVTDDGRVGVAGVPASALSWAQLAAAAEGSLPAGVLDTSDGTEGLAAQLDFAMDGATYPFGAHLAVVEVDVETGAVELLRHYGVDDCGTIVNQLTVTGQQHGGIAQGVAQALWEEFRYDDDGNPRTPTLADYLAPSAADMPSWDTANTVTPSPLNPLGAKGIGESGTTGSTPAVQNAVIDALAHLGVRHLDMPCTPEKVWQAMRDAESGNLPDVWRDPPSAFVGLPAEPLIPPA